MKILVDTADDIQYKSMYIYALLQRFGIDSIHFADRPFEDLSKEARNTKSMRFIIKDTTKERRFVIHCNDQHTINDELYEWADVYGNVNTNYNATSQNRQAKLVSLCPSFAIRYTTKARGICMALATMPNAHINPKKHLGRWKRMLHRLPYEVYSQSKAIDGYLFHCSTLWQSDEWNRNDQTVNLYRAEFIRTCRNVSTAKFEGGLVSYRSDSDAHQFDDCLTNPFNTTDYIQHVKESQFVFNTPAYWGCHGWKLGEYMALGKAMLSTPLINDLPLPLKHGEHYHLIEEINAESMHEAITYMLSHPEYCQKLGDNLRHYWDTYGSPMATLNLLGITK